ncbi:MAG: alpha/beta hydrolase family protein [Acutalibacteraceae bacterium]
MKKLYIPFLFLLLLLLTACGRSKYEQPTVVSSATAVESTTAYITEQQTAASTTADFQSVAGSASSVPQTTEQTTAFSNTTTSESTTSYETSETQTATETQPSASGTYRVSEMRVTRDGLSIYGKLYTPDLQNQKLPTVILSHSANMTSDSMTSYCKRLASSGFVAYAFDFCGGDKRSRSDGSEADMTIFTEVEDLKAVLNEISKLDCVDSENIFLFGTSQGGLVSAITAAECPSQVKALILFYPAFNIIEISQKYGSVMPGSSNTAFVQSLLNYDVYQHIGAFKGDVLILHGTNDFVVPYSYSEKAAKIYENCELHLIKGATHGFNADNYVYYGNFDNETWNYTAAFLEKETSR